jgi:hypothetical protein
MEPMNSFSVERFAAIAFDMVTGPKFYARPSSLGSLGVVMVLSWVAPSDDVKADATFEACSLLRLLTPDGANSTVCGVGIAQWVLWGVDAYHSPPMCGTLARIASTRYQPIDPSTHLTMISIL